MVLSYKIVKAKNGPWLCFCLILVLSWWFGHLKRALWGEGLKQRAWIQCAWMYWDNIGQIWTLGPLSTNRSGAFTLSCQDSNKTSKYLHMKADNLEFQTS